MFNIIMEISKYLILLMMVIYTFECFSVFGYHDAYTKMWILRRQSIWIFMIHFLAFLTLFLRMKEARILVFYVIQVALLGSIILLYGFLYPKVSRLVVNNMCMLLAVGFIMLTRLSYSNAVKQALIVAVSAVLSLFVPVIIRKARFLSRLKIFYAVAGVVALVAVIIVGRVSYGAMLGFEVGGISIQPSELVKIILYFLWRPASIESGIFEQCCHHDCDCCSARFDSCCLKGSGGGADCLCRVPCDVVCGYETADLYCGRLRGRGSCFGSRVFSVFSCENESNGLERSVCCLQQWGISGGAVSVCHRYGKLVWTWTLPGTSG